MYSTVSIRIGPLGVQYCVNKDRGSWCTVLCKLEIAQSEQDVSPFCKESDMTYS